MVQVPNVALTNTKRIKVYSKPTFVRISIIFSWVIEHQLNCSTIEATNIQAFEFRQIKSQPTKEFSNIDCNLRSLSGVTISILMLLIVAIITIIFLWLRIRAIGRKNLL
jgi:hypothetical protein